MHKNKEGKQHINVEGGNKPIDMRYTESELPLTLFTL